MQCNAVDFNEIEFNDSSEADCAVILASRYIMTKIKPCYSAQWTRIGLFGKKTP